MSILDNVGNTPLIRLKFLNTERNVKIYAKAEFMNPSGSVKDRAAKEMLLDGIERGLLTKDKTIIDATSGNTGIAFAMMGAALGYKVKLCIPSNACIERKRLLRVYGARIIETEPLEGIDGAIMTARSIAAAEPDKYFYPDQYSNRANIIAHYKTTAEEIWYQTDERITHFVAGTGTTGTFTGTSKKLKELKPGIEAVIVQPDTPFHGIEGFKSLDATLQPDIFEPQLVDKRIDISTEAAYKMCRRLVREAGLFVGISAGANVEAAKRLAKTVPDNSVIVTVLCDNGTRYFSEPLWEDINDSN
ncbi:MAG: cysteine synthase family protein [Firmicutes bacterium]|nr:cysteine synthase family protein [Bacillota bacterium]